MNHYSHLNKQRTIEVARIWTEAYNMLESDDTLGIVVTTGQLQLLDEHYETVKEDSALTLGDQVNKYDIHVVRHKPAIEFDEDEVEE